MPDHDVESWKDVVDLNIRPAGTGTRDAATASGMTVGGEPTRLDRLTDALLRSALAADAREQPSITDVANAVDEVCVEAHARELRAEQMLVILKSRWRRLPDAHDASRDEASETLARVVTLCIRAYYAR